MVPDNNNEQPEQAQEDPKQQKLAEITPALVQQVADRVYALWLQDFRIERERQRSNVNRWHSPW